MLTWLLVVEPDWSIGIFGVIIGWVGTVMLGVTGGTDGLLFVITPVGLEELLLGEAFEEFWFTGGIEG